MNACSQIILKRHQLESKHRLKQKSRLKRFTHLLHQENRPKIKIKSLQTHQPCEKTQNNEQIDSIKTGLIGKLSWKKSVRWYKKIKMKALIKRKFMDLGKRHHEACRDSMQRSYLQLVMGTKKTKRKKRLYSE